MLYLLSAVIGQCLTGAYCINDNTQMSARISSATERAIAMVQAGVTRYKAAKECGIALSTIYRAMPELNEKEQERKAQQSEARQ